MASPCNTPTLSLLLSLSSLLPLLTLATPTPTQCRTSCGQIPIAYPFGIDDGCGSPYYRRLLICSASGLLELRTPSGRYPVRNISYSDPHLLVTDPSMWTCRDGNNFRPARPFSLDTGTRLRVSPQNDYLFFNCSEGGVIMEAKPAFCERFPERCDSACDTSSYLCRHLPGCEAAARCCAYYPKGSASVGMMLKHCATYTSVYWRNLGMTPAFNQVPEYGVRVDYEVPVTTRCLRCEDAAEGGGRCGFDTATEEFLCLCGNRNVTTYCKDGNSGHHSAAMVAGTVSGVSIVAGAFVGFGVWYVRKVRAKAPVTHGVQTNDNRLF